MTISSHDIDNIGIDVTLSFSMIWKLYFIYLFQLIYCKIILLICLSLFHNYSESHINMINL